VNQLNDMVVPLHHANIKGPQGAEPQTIYVSKTLFFAAYYSEVNKCTHVLSSGGALIPVIETPEDVVKRFGFAFKNGE